MRWTLLLKYPRNTCCVAAIRTHIVDPVQVQSRDSRVLFVVSFPCKFDRDKFGFATCKLGTHVCSTRHPIHKSKRKGRKCKESMAASCMVATWST